VPSSTNSNPRISSADVTGKRAWAADMVSSPFWIRGADANRESKRIAAAERWMMAGHTRRVAIAAEALAEEELAAQHCNRIIDARQLESRGRVARQTVRPDQAS